MLSPVLQEFATRQALLEAVQQPGPLQQSVLAWLPDDRTRAVYGNGGFKIPNIARYSVFNEFDAPAQPAPTTLAVDGYDAASTLRQDLEQGRLMADGSPSEVLTPALIARLYDYPAQVIHHPETGQPMVV